MSSFRYHPDVDGDTQVDGPWALRYPRGAMRNHIQLYYSFDTVADPKITPTGYVTENLITCRDSSLPDFSQQHLLMSCYPLDKHPDV